MFRIGRPASQMLSGSAAMNNCSKQNRKKNEKYFRNHTRKKTI